MPSNSADGHTTSSENPNTDQEAAPWNAVRPGFGLLRRESGFSIASLAASLPGRDRPKSFASTTGSTGEESGQMMVDVSSRPGSVRSMYGSEAGSSEDDESQEDDEDDEEQEREDERHDARSIRSFESMMGRAGRRRRARKSLSDRLASMPGLARFSGPQQAQQQQLVRISSLYVHFRVQSLNNRHLGLAITVTTHVSPSSSSRIDSRRKSRRVTAIESPNVSRTPTHRPSKPTLFGSNRR